MNMAPITLATLPLLLAIAACDPPTAAPSVTPRAAVAQPTPGTSPAAQLPASIIKSPPTPDVPDGPARPIRFADGSRVSLRPWKADAKHGVSDAMCGVRIGTQRVETIGSGETEVYTCDRLVEAGALPSVGGVRRIGLIYDVSSPHAHFRTAIILRGDKTGWRVDPDSVGTYDDTPAARSIATLAKAVR